MANLELIALNETTEKLEAPTSSDTGTIAGALNVAGNVTLSGQPCFLVYNASSDLNVTGTGTVTTVPYATEIVDQGGNFVTATFTAPITGRYLLIANLRIAGTTAAADDWELILVTSNRNYRNKTIFADNLGTQIQLRNITIADMDADDTVTVTIEVNGEASDVVDVQGDADMRTSFSGCLLASFIVTVSKSSGSPVIFKVYGSIKLILKITNVLVPSDHGRSATDPADL